jgi:hypothetical protein
VTRPTFITLGPAGTCHENALLHYLEFQGITSFDTVLVDDLLEAVVQVRDRPHTFLVQCSAHVQVHLVTERYHTDVFVIDTFIYPTKELGLLVRTDVSDPKSLGIVSATRGYLDLSRWATIVDEPSICSPAATTRVSPTSITPANTRASCASWSTTARSTPPGSSTVRTSASTAPSSASAPPGCSTLRAGPRNYSPRGQSPSASEAGTRAAR